MSSAVDADLANEAWAWWQSRRLGYNLALAGAGWAAYGLNVAFFYGFRRPLWQDWQQALSMTLFLGVAFLVLMGAANVFYLLGPAVESLVKPADPARFRRTAHRMGFWGSVALPFAFPMVNLAALIGGAFQ
jgi:Na+/proline symporter